MKKGEGHNHSGCCGVNRRDFLADCGMGFTGLVLGAMLHREGIAGPLRRSGPRQMGNLTLLSRQSESSGCSCWGASAIWRALIRNRHLTSTLGKRSSRHRTKERSILRW